MNVHTQSLLAEKELYEGVEDHVYLLERYTCVDTCPNAESYPVSL